MWDMIWCLWIRLEAIECSYDCDEYKATWDCEHLRIMIANKERREEWNIKQILY